MTLGHSLDADIVQEVQAGRCTKTDAMLLQMLRNQDTAVSALAKKNETPAPAPLPTSEIVFTPKA